MNQQARDEQAPREETPVLLPFEPPVDPTMGGPVVATEYEPAFSRPIDYATPPSLVGRWTVGTLSYTSRGLMALFAVLLCGDFAYSMRERSVGPVVQLMLKRLSASDTLLALLFTTLPTTLSLVIGPVVSYRSDRHRGRWGRRIPFLLIPTPIAAAAMIGIAYTDDLGRQLSHLLGTHAPSQQASALWCFGFFWTLFEVAAVVAGAVLNGLINDVVPRALTGRFYGFFRQVSLGAGIIFNYWIITHADTHYKAIFIGIGLLFFVGFSAMCLAVREGKYPSPPPVVDDGTSRLMKAIRGYVKECFSLAYYRWIFLALTLAGLSLIPVNLFSLVYSRQINVSLETYGHLIAYSYVISFIFASPLGWVVDKIHPLRASIATMAIYAVAMTASGFLIHDAHTFEIAFITHTVLSGCYFTVSAPLGQSLFPRMMYAQFASAGGVASSLLTIIAGPMLGQLLDATHHEYRLTFIVGGLTGCVAAVTLVVVYRGFDRLGGTRNYVAPGDVSFDQDLPVQVAAH